MTRTGLKRDNEGRTDGTRGVDWVSIRAGKHIVVAALGWLSCFIAGGQGKDNISNHSLLPLPLAEYLTCASY